MLKILMVCHLILFTSFMVTDHYRLKTIKNLRQTIHDQQADNENLRFQYNQCKILHIGV